MINYLFITYIVTSKPKRISVADGVVHIVYSPKINKFNLLIKSVEMSCDKGQP